MATKRTAWRSVLDRICAIDDIEDDHLRSAALVIIIGLTFAGLVLPLGAMIAWHAIHGV